MGAPRPEVLWCAGGGGRTWAFPREVDALLREMTAGKSVLHLFGGRAAWGTRLDVDPIVRPDVIADAWLPPFARNSFDVVVMDPPYVKFSGQMRASLAWTASYVARERVIWFSTVWMPSGAGLTEERSWLVRPGRSSQVRCLIVFRRTSRVVQPVKKFTRGPAIKYNRWLAGAQPLPFTENA